MKYIKWISISIGICLLLPYVITTKMSRETKEVYLTQRASQQFLSIKDGEEVKEIAFEDYVAGIAARELPKTCHLETIKAQMVLARTNLCSWIKKHPGELPEEEYLSIEEILEGENGMHILEGAESTKGMIMEWDGVLRQAPFHAISAGFTRNGKECMGKEEYSYLTSVESKKDVEAKRFLTIHFFSQEEMEQALNYEYPQKQLEETPQVIQILERDQAGYVKEIAVGDLVIPGEKFRELLNLPSSCFYLKEVDGNIRITTKGLGHGLGLSQYGAEQMAKQGAGFQEILEYYFPNVQIKEVKKESQK